LALVLAVFTGGTAYFRKVTIVDAVREGARYGASLAIPGGDTTAWEASVKSRVSQVSGGDVTAAEVCAKLVYAVGGNDCGVGDPAGAAAETTVHLVKVSVSKPAKLEAFFFTLDTTLTGKLAARYERDTG
jgi:hypothetical protein